MQSVKASCKFMEGTILGEMQIDNKKSKYIKWICENFNCNQDIEHKKTNRWLIDQIYVAILELFC